MDKSKLLFAIYYALRDMTPEDRKEVVEQAEHDATCAMPQGCEICSNTSTPPDWFPSFENWSRFPYAALCQEVEKDA